jgi:hypothetical protein
MDARRSATARAKYFVIANQLGQILPHQKVSAWEVS